MIYYVSCQSEKGGWGTKERPFKTIGEAAAVAQVGDEVVVAPGVYREYVNPVRGGTDDAHRIIYRSQEPLGAVITGAEVIKNWTLVEGNVWEARIPNALFGAYNPYTTVIAGDWYYSQEPVHTGEVYLNGKSMYEAFSLEAVKNPQKRESSWDPQGTLYQWYTTQEAMKRSFWLISRERIQIRKMLRSMCAATAFIRIKPGWDILHCPALR